MNSEKLPSQSTSWATYYEKTKDLEVPELLSRGIEYVKDKNEAIDIGAGSLRDTKFLIEEGFTVTALDSSPLLIKQAEGLPEDKLNLVNSSYEDFNFPKNKYDFVYSLHSLFFIKPENFNIIFDKIKNSLKTDGILCISLSGEKSTVANANQGSIHTKEGVKNLLSDMEIIDLTETLTDELLVSGYPAKKHNFLVIAKKL